MQKNLKTCLEKVVSRREEMAHPSLSTKCNDKQLTNKNAEVEVVLRVTSNSCKM